ncbi:PHP domain-like protein [Mycena chlorophos]|uniref:PHP domain-like protein n=1 Tax=Mycena chlorophos TaxID=658473 RepID=A0A8H6SP62_MYCCL|nr:PHP domain-like protein [Mycena chlorophos]
MFFDLNVPVHHPQSQAAVSAASSKKGKGKQQQAPIDVVYSPGQIAAIEARVDVLVHLGYTAIAFNQTVVSSVNAKTHANTLEPLLAKLKPRPGIVYLKRLTIVLDQDSEKGTGLILANAPVFKPYDLIALMPTSQNTFALACLSHTVASALTAHIISIPLTLRMDYRLRHTIVRGAIKNGAVFEISYVGALGGEHDAVLKDAGAAESGVSAKRNWWAVGKEIVRITKGKSIMVSGGVVAEADLRAPKDVANLISLLGLPQDVAHAASTKVAKSLVLRAQTRQTYRAVFSEPVLVIPNQEAVEISPTETKKRPREEEDDGEDVPEPAQAAAPAAKPTADAANGEGSSRKKKKRKKGNSNNPNGS